MFARSVYLNQFDNNFKIDENCSYYFTSFHIEEEFDDNDKDKVINLIKFLKQHDKKIIVDISPKGLSFLGYDNIKSFIKDYDIDYIRLDYGFNNDEIVELSKYCNIVINASTFDLTLLDKLDNDAIAIHNFYPRKDTGLDREYFNKRNTILKKHNIKVGAFITGDGCFRQPLYEGLPTLEDCRNKLPYIQYLSIIDDVDLVIVGDQGLSDYQSRLIDLTIKDQIIRLPVILNDEYEYLYNQILTSRIDSPSWLIRIKQSRDYASAGNIIEPDNCLDRKMGCITIDNKNYLRYSGEIQILKKDFEADDKVNIIGKVKQEYLDILKYIKNGSDFIFEK